MTRSWVYQTRCDFILKDVIKAGLIATDAGVDRVRLRFRFVDYFRIGQERACHGNHVSTTRLKRLFARINGVEAVGRNKRNPNMSHQFFRDECKAPSRH